MDQLLARACATLTQYKAYGNEVLEEDSAFFVRNTELPTIYDANHGARIRAESPEEIEALLARSDEVFANFAHRRWFCDPLTPPAFEATLVLAGYELDATLQLVLAGELRMAAPPAVSIRLAENDADWEALTRLHRLDHLEEAQKFDRAPYTLETTRDLVRSKRPKGPQLRFWLVRVDEVDCGFFSSMPGENGVGLVEDLFTQPDFRGRGIATALIAHAVEDARLRGAGPILIGALPEDTPRRMYQALGFRPLCVTRAYLKRQRDGR